MFSLPDWAPNVHPFVVHFPIALLVVAVLTDLLSLALRRCGWLRVVAVGLYALGAAAALVAFLTGRVAAREVLVPAAANQVLTEHEDWAERTLWFYGLFALARIGADWWDRQARLSLHLPLFLIGSGGLILLYETGEHGAQMVFEHGVGVQAMIKRQTKPQGHPQEEGNIWETHEREGSAGPGQKEGSGASSPELAETGLRVEKDGAWRWHASQDVERVLRERFDWIEGGWADLDPAVLHDPVEGDALALHPKGKRVVFVAGVPLQSLQADLRLNADAFDGTIMLIHHVQNAQNYHFLALDTGKMSLGTVTGGVAEVQDSGLADTAGWQPLRLVSQKTHFRGYIGDKMVVHGHGHEPNPGRVGLLVNGTGTLLLDSLEVRVMK